MIYDDTGLHGFIQGEEGSRVDEETLESAESNEDEETKTLGEFLLALETTAHNLWLRNC